MGREGKGKKGRGTQGREGKEREGRGRDDISLHPPVPVFQKYAYTRRYVTSDSCCFPKAAQNLSFLSFVRIVTDTPCTDTPFSCLAVFDFRPL